MSEKKIWTIGHSTHSFVEFVIMLKTFQITVLADIRSLPGSKKFPHFNKESLEQALPINGIQYVHIKELGGRRKTNPESKNTGWRSAAFRGYADYMETEEFKQAAKVLEEIGAQKRTAYMCAESLWWRCHRSLLSDYFKFQGWTVTHIMGAGKSSEHTYTQPAKVSDGILSYEADPESPGGGFSL